MSKRGELRLLCRRRITPKPSNALPSRTRLAGSGTRGGVMAERVDNAGPFRRGEHIHPEILALGVLLKTGQGQS